MTISLSDDVLEAMGLKPLLPGCSLEAVFYSTHVYHLRGATLEEQFLPKISGEVAGFAYTLAVGSSVNAVARLLSQEDYADSEDSWRKELKCRPPYLLVQLGPSKRYASLSDRAKDDGQTIVTYDSFPDARLELKAIEKAVLPSLLSAIACSFSELSSPVRFLPIDRAFFGMTSDKRTILDFRMSASGQIISSPTLQAEQIEDRLRAGSRLAGAMNPKVVRFFHLALDEDEPLKKFLYFFLAIEIETHATYSKVNHKSHLAKLVVAPRRVTVSARDFFEAQRQRAISLHDRFVWCALCVWTHLTDADIKAFKRLKKVRNDIAHGSIAGPPQSAVLEVEQLATKLQISPMQID